MLHSLRLRFYYALFVVLLIGCGEQPPHLEPKVDSPVGRPGVCAHCNEKINNVTQEHLITIDGVEYIVCDQECAADLKRWIAEQ